MHNKERPRDCLFQLFFKCKVDQMKTVTISQMFNHVYNDHVYVFIRYMTGRCTYTNTYSINTDFRYKVHVQYYYERILATIERRWQTLKAVCWGDICSYFEKIECLVTGSFQTLNLY